MIELLACVAVFCLAIPIYVYVGYPVLLFLLVRVFKLGRPTHKSEEQPKVTLIVSCYNEVDVLNEKIENCLSLDYPEEKLDFIFISDGSDDGSDELISSYPSDRIKLIRQEGRLGKTSGLNLAIPEVTGNVVVFSDANAMYRPDAVAKLVRHFSDATVGYVVGAALYTDGDTSSAAESENTYWNYEIYMKQLESELHSVVGGDGAIYAIRRELYVELDQKDINDFVNPLQIVAKGYRGVFDAEAICDEETAGEFAKEGRRKQRIVNRSFRAVLKNSEVLNPFKVGFFSIEILSHKFLRWLVPFFILVFGACTLVLSHMGVGFYQLMFALTLAYLVLALIGYVKSEDEEQPRITQFAYYFYLVNYCSMMGVVQYFRGETQVTWTSSRQKEDNQGGFRLTTNKLFIGLIIVCFGLKLLVDIVS